MCQCVNQCIGHLLELTWHYSFALVVTLRDTAANQSSVIVKWHPGLLSSKAGCPLRAFEAITQGLLRVTPLALNFAHQFLLLVVVTTVIGVGWQSFENRSRAAASGPCAG